MEQVKSIKKVSYSKPPDGEYEGTWSGYVVSFSTEYGTFECDMETGIRGSAKCKIEVKSGVVRVAFTI